MKLNEELLLKMFLEGDGMSLGKKDEEVFVALQAKKTDVDKEKFPNLFRWMKFMEASKKK